MILKEMVDMNERSEINYNIKIDFHVPVALQDIMNMAEAADAEGNLGLYYDLAENVDTIAKNFYTDGKLTQKQWDTLCRRYCL